MGAHKTVEGIYGPGTFADAEFTALPAECRRLLRYFAEASPGFTKDPAILNAVEFYGSELPILPGPLKAQALVCFQDPDRSQPPNDREHSRLLAWP